MISISVEPGLKYIKNKMLFESLKSVWLEFCKTFEASYGYTYVYDSKGINLLGPRGDGLCLPRLYWQTYLGREYINAFGINPNTSFENCDIDFVNKDSVVITLKNDNPLNLIVPNNEIENEMQQQLGINYFWSPKDNWRNPKFEYLMPNIDFSEVVTNKSAP